MEPATDWQIFISYSHDDRFVVVPLTELIKVTGVSVFRDDQSIPKGKRWRLVISESLSSCRTVLVFWSGAASRSQAVREEFRKAIELVKDVVPILLDETALDDALKEYQWIDLREIVKLGTITVDMNDRSRTLSESGEFLPYRVFVLSEAQEQSFLSALEAELMKSNPRP